MKIKLALFFIVFFVSVKVNAQNEDLKYQDWVYKPYIKTVQFDNVTSQDSPAPVIPLVSSEKLLLQFDDLNAGTQDYYYTIVHCTADWKPSNISSIDYLEGYTEDRIIEYKYSFNTIQSYTHYGLVFPSNTMKPLIPGNYLLKVYLNNDPNDLVLTRRFYVNRQQVNITAEVTRGTVIKNRNQTQKINFTIQHPALNVSNPMAEIKTVITQNDRPDNVISGMRPTFIRTNELVYNDMDSGTFTGGSEFRNFDTRSLRFFSQHIQDIQKEKSRTDVYLFGDDNYGQTAYSTVVDLNGSYAIRNQDGGGDSEVDADYTRVHFALTKTEPSTTGDYYLFGKLTDYQIKDDYKLYFNEVTRALETQQMVKQGYYDYSYVFVPNGQKVADECATEGCHFETDNVYTIYVYFKPPGKRYDELVGVRRFNSKMFFIIR
ncbi:DUF5103 domain-containing protein [Solitalea sp. MAHUQ-68]|uniref:DUF5103 domain-containing protein n=1 Tax=Solitalea agri TaxID=2953739 RepID=A0A9X2EYT2_9SPHI|nr:DUF5103 domain-containing protein [Solitalea agri]MCO4291497.1 DUF5103 domain-containing protein [Solitalea agri]